MEALPFRAGPGGVCASPGAPLRSVVKHFTTWVRRPQPHYTRAVSGNRDALLARLAEEGDRRRTAQATERAAVEAIAKLIPRALNAGISKREISRCTGLSRPWIDELLQRHGSDTQR